jgi:glycosyltransferase involved in cell wall biosynthesis
MKKVLFICSSFPWPPTDGERLRTFNLVRELAKHTELTIAHPGPGDLPKSLANFFPPSTKWQSYEKRQNNFLTKLHSLISLTPVFYKMARSHGLIDWMRCQNKGAFDVVHLDGLPAFNYYNAAQAITSNVVLDLRDSWSLLYRRLYETNGRKLKQLIKGRLVGRIEAEIVRRCKKLILISGVDAQHIEARYPDSRERIRIIANGVSEEFLNILARSISGNRPTLAFTGAMDYAPNEQAAIFFAQHVMPVLRQKHPTVRFFIVGKNPTSELLKLASDSVIVTGEVPSVANYLKDIDIVVAPLLSGAGMKNKVLEALAASRPLVASKVAVEGIDLSCGNDYLLAETSEEWVAAVDQLLQDPAQASKIAENGKDKVRTRYSWPSAGQAVIDLYEGEQ